MQSVEINKVQKWNQRCPENQGGGEVRPKTGKSDTFNALKGIHMKT